VTDGLAVASLVVSCAGLLVGFLTGPVGVGLGIAALRRIRRTGAQGRGLAIAGVVVGGIMTALMVAAVVLVVVLAATVGSDASSAGDELADDWSQSAPSDATMPPFELTVLLEAGDCLDVAPETYDMTDASTVPCGDEHGAEVLSVLPVSAPLQEDLTSDDPVWANLSDWCGADAATVLDGVPWVPSASTDVYYPHPDQWDAGDAIGRSAYCVLVVDEPVTGSAVLGTLADAAGPTGAGV
jgi:hypothetical protein